MDIPSRFLQDLLLLVQPEIALPLVATHYTLYLNDVIHAAITSYLPGLLKSSNPSPTLREQILLQLLFKTP